jgi:predicted nucleic acid-binding Zn ribbon protein
MNCRFCGTALPEGALFCGECGRPAPEAQAPTPVRTRPVMPAIVFSSESEREPIARAVALADSEFSCPQCGASISEDDVFCGECGFVLSSSYLSAPVDAVGEVRQAEEPAPVDDVPPVDDYADDEVTDTGEITGVSGWVAVASDPESSIELVPDVEPDPEPEPDPVAEEPEPVAEEPEPEPEPVVEPVAFVEPVADDPEPVAEEPPAAAPAPPPKVLRAVPDPFPWGKDPREPTVDLEATRISAAPPAEERFVLQFSTGESVTVSGAGLVGRNPASQPGEFVDQLVTIFDAGKSVSKTHLEFGQDSGRFWVSDRYSTNGSTVRQPDAEPKRCEPGRRYFVARGTRVDIGEQFFVVS